MIIEAADGRPLARAYANPASLIAARVTSFDSSRTFDSDLLRRRLCDALEHRDRRYGKPWYRWVHGEGDGLPGLVVDRYEDVLVVQIGTAGMERWRETLVELLIELCRPKAIELRADLPVRDLEGLERYREWVYGEPASVHVLENGLEFATPEGDAQKTGWFYDHRDNRARLRAYVEGARVLDLYTYLGAFAINAAYAGASEVIAIDSSAPALELARCNASRNGVDSRVDFRCADVVESCKALIEAGERFDAVVLDPPAFIKRRKDFKAGSQHYGLNNRLALKLLKPGGVLFSASCSHAFEATDLLRSLRNNVPRGSTGLQIVEYLHQAADHPVHPSMPETNYLKGYGVRLMPS